MQTDPKIQVIANYQCLCGEGPTWHPGQNKLYWNDNETSRFFCYDVVTQQHKLVYDQRMVTACTLEDQGALILYMDRGSVAAYQDGKIRWLIKDIPQEHDSRFNDAIADPMGRVFVGTMPTDSRGGRLYRIDPAPGSSPVGSSPAAIGSRPGRVAVGEGSNPNLTVTCLLEDLTCPNGMSFSPDLKTFYFTDSMVRTIWQFDYELHTGNISNQRPFIQLDESDGLPDGLTRDSEGCFWSVLYGGQAVVRFSPLGKELERIALPCKMATCPIFGGADLTDLYITTGGGADKQTNGQDAGALLRLKPGVKGVAEYFSRLVAH